MTDQQAREASKRKVSLHSRVFYVHDQVTLAVFHRRPKDEVDLLLEELREAIKVSKES